MKEKGKPWACFVTRIATFIAVGAFVISTTPFSVSMGAGISPMTGGQAYPPIAPVVGPASGDIPADTIIYTLFSDPMAQNSVQDAFTIEPAVTGTFNWTDDRQMIFEPDASLTENVTYTVRLNASVAHSSYVYYLDGNSNGISEGSPTDDVVWNFTAKPPKEPEPISPDPQPWAQFLKTHKKSGHYVGDVRMGETYFYGSIGARADSSPIVGAGIVVVGDNNGMVYGFKESDLSPAWTLAEKDRESSRIRTMALKGETNPAYFYVATEGGLKQSDKPKLYMRYLSTGEKVKGNIAGSVAFREKNSRIYSPITFAPKGSGEITSDRVYVLVNEVVRGTELVHLYGYSTSLKKLELEYVIEYDAVLEAGIAVADSASNPSVRRLVFGTQNQQVYSVPENYVEGQGGVNFRDAPGMVYSTPSVDGASVYVTSHNPSGMHCFLSRGSADMETPYWEWQTDLSYPPLDTVYCWSVSSPINDGERVYVSYIQRLGTGGPPISAIRAFDSIGNPAWPDIYSWWYFNNLDPMWEVVSPSPAVADGFVFHIVRSRAVFPSFSGYIYQLNKSSGDYSRHHKLPDQTYFSKSSVALHYWNPLHPTDKHYRTFAMYYDDYGSYGPVEIPDY